MSRSGYSDEIEDMWQLIRWRGAVNSAIRGKRGQAFLRELLAALDAMPAKKLIRHELVDGGEVCAMGSIGMARGIKMDSLDPYDYDAIAKVFGVSAALVREIEYENDEWSGEDSEFRWRRVRGWVAEQIVLTPEELAPIP